MTSAILQKTTSLVFQCKRIKNPPDEDFSSDDASASIEETYSKFEPSSKVTLLSRLPYKLSAEAFYSATTEQERDLLRFEVNCALQHFIEFDRPIFLEGLGLFIPSRTERETSLPLWPISDCKKRDCSFSYI